MRVLVLENYPHTPLGQVGTALIEAGAEIDFCRAFSGDALPAGPGAHDALVVLGGAQSALDDVDSPWLPAAAALSRGFAEADKAVLGICLGAQLVHAATAPKISSIGRSSLAGTRYDRRKPAVPIL
jgi:GMP synthase (glutamine-hydrolysing)